MSYWADDKALGREQRRLDAQQARAKERMERRQSDLPATFARSFVRGAGWTLGRDLINAIVRAFR